MKPYFQDDAVTIYHADNREILQELGKFDLLLTDPPYGIGADNRKRILSRGKLAAPKDYGESKWDEMPVDAEVLNSFRERCDKQIIWGGGITLNCHHVKAPLFGIKKMDLMILLTGN